MKKTLSFISFGIAMSIFSSLTTKPTVYAQSLSASPFIAESDITLTAPYFLYIQSIDLQVSPGPSETSYTIVIDGTNELKSVIGTATLYKQNSSGTYVKKASKKHTFSGSNIIENFTFNSYGPGKYKLTFEGTAYSIYGGGESISISTTNSY